MEMVESIAEAGANVEVLEYVPSRKRESPAAKPLVKTGPPRSRRRRSKDVAAFLGYLLAASLVLLATKSALTSKQARPTTNLSTDHRPTASIPETSSAEKEDVERTPTPVPPAPQEAEGTAEKFKAYDFPNIADPVVSHMSSKEMKVHHKL